MIDYIGSRLVGLRRSPLPDGSPGVAITLLARDESRIPVLTPGEFSDLCIMIRAIDAAAREAETR